MPAKKKTETSTSSKGIGKGKLLLWTTAALAIGYLLGMNHTKIIKAYQDSRAQREKIATQVAETSRAAAEKTIDVSRKTLDLIDSKISADKKK